MNRFLVNSERQRKTGQRKPETSEGYPTAGIRQPLFALAQDRRGVSVVTYVLVLPLLLLMVFGAATVWRVISVKQSMDYVTYEAARYLSREGRSIAARAHPYYSGEEWGRIAHEAVDDWIRDQIRRNPFVHDADNISIEIVPPVDVDCNPWGVAPKNTSRAPENIRFTITTALDLKSAIDIPFLDAPATFVLRERHSELVECPRFSQDPPDEGEIFFQSGRR